MRKSYYMDFEKSVVELEHKLELLKQDELANKPDIRREIEWLEKQVEKLKARTYSDLTAWRKVKISRHPERPHFSAYREAIFSDWHELHGDRSFKDDPAVVGGLAEIDGRKVLLVGQEKGADTKDRIYRNFGMPHPEGYRKAIRLFELAGKFELPLITFIDTPGAYAGVGAEERGQAGAIAQCLGMLSDLPVPVVAVNIGEGGSGGALAFGVADRVIMLENAYYSVITPEGCASILWQSKERAAEAAEALALTANRLLEMGVIDTIVPEPLGGAHRDPAFAVDGVKKEINRALEELSSEPADGIVKNRYEKIRRIGFFTEPDAAKNVKGGSK